MTAEEKVKENPVLRRRQYSTMDPPPKPSETVSLRGAFYVSIKEIACPQILSSNTRLNKVDRGSIPNHSLIEDRHEQMMLGDVCGRL